MWSIWHSATHSLCLPEWAKRKVYLEINQILKVFFNSLRKKINDFGEIKIPTRQVMNKVQFHQEEKCEFNKTRRRKLTVDVRWNGSWKITADIDSVLVFPTLITNKRLDLVIWNEKDKKAMVLELTIPRRGGGEF